MLGRCHAEGEGGQRCRRRRRGYRSDRAAFQTGHDRREVRSGLQLQPTQASRAGTSELRQAPP